MSLLMVVGCLVALFAVAVWRDYDGIVQIIFSIFTVVFVVVFFSCLDVLRKEADYAVSLDRISIAERRAEQLIPALKSEVASYLKHEREAYGELSPENAQLLLIRYPELRSVETVKGLLDEIAKARNLAYEYEQQRLGLKASLLFHQRWPFTPWTPVVLP